MLVKIREFETSEEKIEYLMFRRDKNEIEIRAMGYDGVLIIIDEIPVEKFQQMILQALSSVEIAEVLMLKTHKTYGDDTK